jgi:hypothetical protein
MDGLSAINILSFQGFIITDNYPCELLPARCIIGGMYLLCYSAAKKGNKKQEQHLLLFFIMNSIQL